MNKFAIDSTADRQYEENIRSLAVAMFTEKVAIVTVRGDSEHQTIQGRITKLDKERKRIKIENAEEYCWVDFPDVAGIELVLD
ncbi:YolD-like family protein [Paenibacillus mesophilus]|uniref:YolD-like family protein n=1 Tax=Paenibacillus mesophilus TaxID=2582849 RepID=UPI00110E5EF9|nr:YolD-like family protein [Paenibacillus mesophilus]TMV46589.1 YolD-like family protein [Paenibacillus mesophilus]